MSWWCSAKVESLRHWSDGWYHPPGVGNRWGVFTDEMRDSRVTGYLDLLREAMKRVLIILVALIVIFPGWVGSLQSIHVDSHVDWCRSHGENNHHFGLGFAEAQWNIEESMSHLPKVRDDYDMRNDDSCPLNGCLWIAKPWWNLLCWQVCTVSTKQANNWEIEHVKRLNRRLRCLWLVILHFRCKAPVRDQNMMV